MTLEDGQQLDSLEGYEEVYVGYPIWWDEAPAMITSFLEQFDFAGKAIAPFCTSAYSSIDNSLHIFGEHCPDAVLMEGLTANDDGKLEEWVHAVHSDMTAAGKQVRLTAGEVEVIVTLNGSRAAASLVEMLPLELTLIERENFAKGMTLPDPLADTEKPRGIMKSGISAIGPRAPIWPSSMMIFMKRPSWRSSLWGMRTAGQRP